MRLCPILGNFTKEKPVALMAILAHLKETSDHCSVYEGEPVCV